MNPYVGRERELYDEAMRVIPGVLSVRLRGSAPDAARLLSGYLEEARARQVTMAVAWAIYGAAAIEWLSRLVHREAVDGDVDDAAVVERMVAFQLEVSG